MQMICCELGPDDEPLTSLALLGDVFRCLEGELGDPTGKCLGTS